jgi:hypothetical protein
MPSVASAEFDDWEDERCYICGKSNLYCSCNDEYCPECKMNIEYCRCNCDEYLIED